MVIRTFDHWFDGLSAEDQDELISHIFKKKLGVPIMEGLFAGPHGKVDKGVFSGPAGRLNQRVCSGCGRPI